MNSTAAHLPDRVFPHAPVRQWVLPLLARVPGRRTRHGRVLPGPPALNRPGDRPVAVPRMVIVIGFVLGIIPGIIFLFC